MNYTQEYFLYILKCFYSGEKCNEPSKEVDNKALCRLSKIQDVEGIVFSKIKDLSFMKNTEAYETLKTNFFSLTMLNIQMEQNLNYLLKLFNQNHIEHILFKGSIVSKAYPSKELRTMGDYDVLIHKENFDEVDKILRENGFEYFDEGSEAYTKDYYYNKTLFEIHLNLSNKNPKIHSGNSLDFFSNAFSHTVKINDCTFTLDPTYHMMFLICHLEKHFEQNGCGIRMFLDLPFFFEKNPINIEKLEKWVGELKLTDFTTGIFHICNRIFASKLPQFTKFEIDNELLDYTLEKILNGGTFGHIGKSDAQKIMMMQAKNHYDSNKLSGKIKGFFRWAFPPREYMVAVEMWDMDKPVILLPVYYIKRFYRTYKKKGGLRNWLNEMKNSNVDYNAIKIIDKFGINK